MAEIDVRDTGPDQDARRAAGHGGDGRHRVIAEYALDHEHAVEAALLGEHGQRNDALVDVVLCGDAGVATPVVDLGLHRTLGTHGLPKGPAARAATTHQQLACLSVECGFRGADSAAALRGE